MIGAMLTLKTKGEPDGAADRKRAYSKLLTEIEQIKRDGFYWHPISGPRNRMKIGMPGL